MAKHILLDGNTIRFKRIKDDDYISITDIANSTSQANGEARHIIRNWLRNKNTLEFIDLWEFTFNPNFNRVEFDTVKSQAGSNSFTISPKSLIINSKLKGIRSDSGRYGGTYAHKDIAFEFATWISPAFKLRLILEYQQLKESEASDLNIEWDSQRFLASQNYHIHTDSIEKFLIPKTSLPENLHSLKYVYEADLLNKVVFGMTAKHWQKENPELHKKGKNIRDYATANELHALANLESLNANLNEQGIEKKEKERILKQSFDREIAVLNQKRPEGNEKFKIDSRNLEQTESTFNQNLMKALSFTPETIDIKKKTTITKSLWKYALVVMYKNDEETITTKQINEGIPKLIEIPIELLEPLKGRKDDKYSQHIRNLKSHKKQKNNFIYQGYAEDVKGGFKITQKGIDFVESEMKEDT